MFKNGEIVTFQSDGLLEKTLNGATFRIISTSIDSSEVICVSLPSGKEIINVAFYQIKIGFQCNIKNSSLVGEPPKPYVHVPIKHAYFYHSVGD